MKFQWYPDGILVELRLILEDIASLFCFFISSAHCCFVFVCLFWMPCIFSFLDSCFLEIIELPRWVFKFGTCLLRINSRILDSLYHEGFSLSFPNQLFCGDLISIFVFYEFFFPGVLSIWCLFWAWTTAFWFLGLGFERGASVIIFLPQFLLMSMLRLWIWKHWMVVFVCCNEFLLLCKCGVRLQSTLWNATAKGVLQRLGCLSSSPSTMCLEFDTPCPSLRILPSQWVVRALGMQWWEWKRGPVLSIIGLGPFRFVYRSMDS